MNQNIQEIKNKLNQLGFSANEIKVYIATAQLKETTAAKIAQKVSLPRTTVISVLTRLKEQKYLANYVYKGTTYYWIESPYALTQALEQKLKIAQNLKESLANYAIHKAIYLQPIFLFQKAALKTIYSNLS